MRFGLAILVTAAVGALCALILGEYEQAGLLPLVAGAFVGFGLAEVLAVVAKQRSVATAAAATVLAVGAVAWGVWISTSGGIAPVATTARAAPVVAGVIAAVSSLSARGTGGPHGRRDEASAEEPTSRARSSEPPEGDSPTGS